MTILRLHEWAFTGERLLEIAGAPTLQPVEVVSSPAVTHVKYRVVR